MRDTRLHCSLVVLWTLTDVIRSSPGRIDCWILQPFHFPVISLGSGVGGGVVVGTSVGLRRLLSGETLGLSTLRR